MGCACTKGELTGPGKHGLGRRRRSSTTSAHETSAMKTKQQQQQADSSKSEKTSNSSSLLRTLSMKKPFALFRDSQLRKSTNNTKLTSEQQQQQQQQQPLNEQDITIKSINLNDSTNLDNSNVDTLLSNLHPTNNCTNNNSTSISKKPLTISSSIYSFLNLPTKTQYLLNAQHEFDADYAAFLSASPLDYESLLKKYSLKYNSLKQVQLYVSATSSLLSLNVEANVVSLVEQKLMRLCAEHNLDLHLLDFGSSLAAHSLNKYFRRFLGKLIISDLLSISKSTINNDVSTSGYFIFIIILSDCEFADTNENLLCPDELDITDFNDHIRPHLSDHEQALFTKCYTQSKYEKTKYKLNLHSHHNQKQEQQTQSEEEEEEELATLLSAFKRALADNDSLSLKYIKSAQQEEIELVCSHTDPAQILWLNLNNNDSSQSSRTRLNQMRFETSLKLLQSHVLAHNYKETTLSELNSTSSEQFVYTSVKQLVEQYVEDLNKKQAVLHALKIDQRLAHELLTHYEIYKYLRVKNDHLNHIKPSRAEINAKFLTHLNDYLRTKSSRHPLVINNYKFKPSYVTTDEIIAKFISDSTLATRNHRSIVYRFCGRTCVSSHLSTMLQSVCHQLCYLLDIHESWSFTNSASLIENLTKLLEKHHADDRQLVVFLDRIDRVVRNKHDQLLLANLIDKLYSSSSVCSALKLVLTCSLQSDQFAQMIQPLFKQEITVVHSLHLGKHQINDCTTYAESLARVRVNLATFFSVNQMREGVKLVECMLEVLFKSRYGLKQSEVISLVRQYAHTNCVSNGDYLSRLCWSMLKHYSNLYKHFGLVETLCENNQILFRLDKHLFSHDTPLGDDLKTLLTSYFKQSLDSSDHSCEIARTRAYQELTNPSLTSHHDVYFTSFISNYDWFLRKLNACDSNILFLVHDMDTFKTLVNSNDSSSLVERPEHEKDQHKLFEHLFYETLYALHQDSTQIYTQFKAYLNVYLRMNRSNALLTQMLANLDKHFGLHHIQPFNYENLIECELLQCSRLDKEKVAFNNLPKELTYLSKVVFLNSSTVLALSDSHNEIKIWRVLATNIELVRAIKLNKQPRDLRLLNEKIAVVLVDRNLHLFDLNESKHVLDMNSTMSANVPFFEIHDQNHVVLLARNRLSVILMKVSPQTDDQATVTTQASSITKTYSADDDMFLFKVGEDRYLNSLLVSKNGQVMVCGDEVQKPFPLLVWNLNKRKLVYDLRQAKHEFITSIQAIGSSGKFVVCACQEEGELKNCLIVYDLLTGQLFKKLKSKFNFVSVEISEEANALIACLENSQLIVYDLTNGSEKCIINSNRFPVNKIKMLDTKSIFITYDTRGLDWTVRAWDLTKLDKNPLIGSFTCPTRIISCSINADQFSSSSSSSSSTTTINDDSLIGLALYGIQQPLILRLASNKVNSSSKLVASSEFNSSQSNNSDLFNKTEQLNKEINL